MSTRIILYAPNVHTGGGYVLLQALLTAWPKGVRLTAFLDVRSREKLTLPDRIDVVWVAPTLGARLRSEFGLRGIARATDTIICFNGLPPILPVNGKVIVYFQNRHVLPISSLRGFSLQTRIRLMAERAISRFRGHRVRQYFVQTPTMARDLLAYLGNRKRGRNPEVTVFPFLSPPPTPPQSDDRSKDWDFIYVADGEGHKNHKRLLKAWCELAELGIRPRLALTLPPRHRRLAEYIECVSIQHGLAVCNVGEVAYSDIVSLYRGARALIFVSVAESFGLPLVEARQIGLPILAPELDYVRDVCEPVETFDPYSSHSIARAVRRFLGYEEPRAPLFTAGDFWNRVTGEVH